SDLGPTCLPAQSLAHKSARYDDQSDGRLSGQKWHPMAVRYVRPAPEAYRQPHKRLATTPLPANAGRDHSNAVNRSAASSQQRPVWLAMPQGSDKKPDGREAHRMQTHG